MNEFIHDFTKGSDEDVMKFTDIEQACSSSTKDDKENYKATRKASHLEDAPESKRIKYNSDDTTDINAEWRPLLRPPVTGDCIEVKSIEGKRLFIKMNKAKNNRNEAP